jgi:hypothetical protein
MLKTNYEFAECGITVPYGHIFDGVRRNSGFVDARGRPDLAAAIPECAASDALRALLVKLASATSPLFTLGCDLGSHEETGQVPTTFAAGGYIQFMRAKFAEATSSDYLALAQDLSQTVNAGSGGHEWELCHVQTAVDFRLNNHCGIIPSLWTWFFARAVTRQEAFCSRELLIDAVKDAIEPLGSFNQELCVAPTTAPGSRGSQRHT